MMLNPEDGKLPYLECVNAGTIFYNGYVGQEQIIGLLVELGLPQDNEDQPEN